jgi:hypothetical protein
MLAVLEEGLLKAVVVDNDDHSQADGHLAGYNGLASLTHEAAPSNLLVPKYAGLNLELYFDAVEGNPDLLFEPRRAPMTLRQMDRRTAELHQPPTPHWKVESWTTFSLVAPHYVDFEFRAIPHEKTFDSSRMGVFWASYIQQPEDPALYFVARDVDGGQKWIRHYTEHHGHESTHRHTDDPHEILATDAHTRMMYASMSPWRYAKPYYYGLSGDMAYVFMAEDSTCVRFTQSPSGGGGGNPAWDFQLVVPDYEVGEEYHLRARVAYKRFVSRDDIASEYDRWLGETDGRA